MLARDLMFADTWGKIGSSRWNCQHLAEKSSVMLPGVGVEADTVVALKRLVNRHMQRDQFNLVSCLAQSLWTKGPVALLDCSMLIFV